MAREGHLIGPVITNNFDVLAARAGLTEYCVRRYDEIIPDVPLLPGARALLVVGSHADRRAVQARARAAGKKIFYLDPEGFRADGTFQPYPLESPQTGRLGTAGRPPPAGLPALARMLRRPRSRHQPGRRPASGELTGTPSRVASSPAARLTSSRTTDGFIPADDLDPARSTAGSRPSRAATRHPSSYRDTASVPATCTTPATSDAHSSSTAAARSATCTGVLTSSVNSTPLMLPSARPAMNRSNPDLPSPVIHEVRTITARGSRAPTTTSAAALAAPYMLTGDGSHDSSSTWRSPPPNTASELTCTSRAPARAQHPAR